MIRGPEDITLLIDGVIFQLQKGMPLGISNVWKNLLDSISQNNRFKKVILLDRGNAPKYEKFEMVPFAQFSDENFETDSSLLEQTCKDREANLFISTYFTFPKTIYSISYLHDFIPERMGMNLNAATWKNKTLALEKARGYIGVSNTTLDDLALLHPRYYQKPRSLVYNSISEDFRVYAKPEVEAIKSKYGIRKKFFLILGQRMTYKNVIVFFKAFAELKNKDEFQIVCVGGYKELEYILRFYVEPFDDFVNISVNNPELSMIMNAAEAVVYPSVYEGFGMPILEGMSSGCPTIVARQATASLEVAAHASVAINGHSVEEMVRALEKVQRPEVRIELVEKGKKNITRFGKEKSLEQFYAAIMDNVPSMLNYYGRKK